MNQSSACVVVLFLSALATSPLAAAAPPQEPQPRRETAAEANVPRDARQLGIEFAVTASKIRRAIVRTNTPYGFAVRSVAKGSLAERAGLARGTIVLEVNGQPLREVADLDAALAAAAPGGKLVLWCATRKPFQGRFERHPWVERAIGIDLPAPPPPPLADGKLGLRFAVLESKLRRSLIRTRTPYGFVVGAVAKGSPAEQAGITTGTIVLLVEGRQFRELRDLEQALANLAPGDEISLRCAQRKPGAKLGDRDPWLERTVRVALPAPPADRQRESGRRE